jgi:hypothetical protein
MKRTFHEGALFPCAREIGVTHVSGLFCNASAGRFALPKRKSVQDIFLAMNTNIKTRVAPPVDKRIAFRAVILDVR